MIYCVKLNVMSNFACDWLTLWLYVACDAHISQKKHSFLMFIVKKYIRMGITIFIFFIWGGMLSHIKV